MKAPHNCESPQLPLTKMPLHGPCPSKPARPMHTDAFFLTLGSGRQGSTFQVLSLFHCFQIPVFIYQVFACTYTFFHAHSNGGKGPCLAASTAASTSFLTSFSMRLITAASPPTKRGNQESNRQACVTDAFYFWGQGSKIGYCKQSTVSSMWLSMHFQPVRIIALVDQRNWPRLGSSVEMPTPTPITNRTRFLDPADAGGNTERLLNIVSQEVQSKGTSSHCLQRSPTVAEVQLLDALDGVPLLAHRVDFVTRAVRGARVRHGVAVVPGS